MTHKKIAQLYKKYAVPDNIIDHMKMVAMVSEFIGKKINQNQKRIRVDLNTIVYAALLHDLLKVCDFSVDDKIFSDQKYSEYQKKIWIDLITNYKSKGHIKAAVDLLREMGEKKIAGLIEKHDYISVIAKEPSKRPNSIEEKIIYYADKRVLHNKVVNMRSRFNDGKKRYPDTGLSEHTGTRIEKKAFEIEKELCGLADIDPTDLEKLTFYS